MSDKAIKPASGRERLLADLLADSIAEIKDLKRERSELIADCLRIRKDLDFFKHLGDQRLATITQLQDDRRVFLERLNMFESEISRLSKL